MKKILLIFFLLVLVLISIFVFKPKLILAEETPDAFLMNEIYLYNYDTFNLNPNFTDDYLMKATILPEDIQSNNQSQFYGWYKDLGYNNLIIPYYGDQDPTIYVYFAVPLNGIIASNFQLAYSVQTSIDLTFYLLYDDGTRETWNTEIDGYRTYIHASNENLTKNCYAIIWEARNPDYIPSFKFLGVTESFDYGYEIGYSDGYSYGIDAGFNSGYNNGYRDGLTEQDITIYDKILNFNQLVKNGNFNNQTEWTAEGGTVTIQNNIATFLANTQNGTLSQYNIAVSQNDKLLMICELKTSTATTSVRISHRQQTEPIQATTDWQKVYFIADAKPNTQGNTFVQIIDGRPSDWDDIYIKFVELINLTQMYGAGFEPTIEECKNIFTSYYPYSTGSPIEMGYYTGYYDGKDDGLNEGINIGESNQISMSWIQEIFRAMGTFFNIQIFPRVTIGIIVGIPFVISLAWFVIRMFRGGGGGE